MKNDTKEILKIIYKAAKSLHIDIMLIGAYSRDYWRNHFKINANVRTTMDIDFVCQVTAWDEYQKLFNVLQDHYGFTKDKKKIHTLWFNNKRSVDLLPIGDVIDSEGELRWPPKFETSLCLLGYDAAKNDAGEIVLENDMLKVIKPYWLALLKLQAYIESPSRQKDLIDFYFLLEYYSDFINVEERLYNAKAIDKDIFDMDNYDSRVASAILIARDCLRSNKKIAQKIMEKINKFDLNNRLTIAFFNANIGLSGNIAQQILFSLTHEWENFSKQ
ncbi:MAG: hypothetical protein WCS73_10460 [Lentisphaeria bacterium]